MFEQERFRELLNEGRFLNCVADHYAKNCQTPRQCHDSACKICLDHSPLIHDGFQKLPMSQRPKNRGCNVPPAPSPQT